MPYYTHRQKEFRKKARYLRRRNAARRIQRGFRARKRKSNLTKRVYKLINATKTYSDYYLNISPSSSGMINELGLLNIIEGTGVGQRQGDKIELKSVSIRSFCFTLNTLAVNADAFNNLRIIIFSLPQPITAGVGVSVSDILQDLDVLSHYKKDSQVKFKIHHDVLYYLDNQQLGGTPRWSPITAHQKKYFKKMTFPTGLPITYNSGGDIIKNDLLMLAISDSGLVPHPIIQGRVRLTFQP